MAAEAPVEPAQEEQAQQSAQQLIDVPPIISETIIIPPSVTTVSAPSASPTAESAEQVPFPMNPHPEPSAWSKIADWGRFHQARLSHLTVWVRKRAELEQLDLTSMTAEIIDEQRQGIIAPFRLEERSEEVREEINSQIRHHVGVVVQSDLG